MHTLCATLLLLLSAAPAFAQSAIVLDGSLPHGRTDDVTSLQPAPNYLIGEDLGWQVGSNLFHSFSLFSIGPGHSATFTEDPALNAGLPLIGNVIARVTGGAPSSIDGLLRSTIPNADLFLLNPAGVLFGGGSVIDVPGSLTVSTAHSLIYAGGTEALSTAVAANPVLRAAAPEAFGFLGGMAAADLVFGNPDPNVRKPLGVPDGETFTAIGGNVRVENNTGLQAFGGRVQVAAVGSAVVTVPLDVASWNVAPGSSAQLGEVHLENRSALDTLPFDTAVPQGEVVIRGGRLTLADRALVRGGGATPGGTAVDIAVAEDVSLDGGSELRIEAQGGLAGGTLRVSAARIALANQSLVRTRVFDFGGSERGGDISLRAGAVELDRSSIVSTTEGAGAAGSIEIIGDQIDVDSSSIVAPSGTLGRGGNIAIEAGNLTLRGTAAQILTSNSLTGPSAVRSGTIDITATGAVRVTDGAVIASDAKAADTGGDITIAAHAIEVSGGGADAGGTLRDSAIETSALATGAGGSIHLVADDVRIARDGGLFAGAVRTFVAPDALGAGGDIEIAARNLTLAEGGQISTTTRSIASVDPDGPAPAGPLPPIFPGSAGSISIDAAERVLLVGQDTVDGVPRPSSISARSEADADANSISLAARSIEVLDGAQISARAAGAGSSGDVTLAASDRITVRGFASGFAAQGSVVSARAVDGPGGDLIVSAPVVEVLDGGSLDVSSSGAGLGGQLIANVGSLTVAGASPRQVAAVAAQADGSGDARGIAITASSVVRVGAGGEISASASDRGSPGDIAVTAGAIDIAGGRITAEASESQGGNITLAALGDVTLTGAEVTARSDVSGDAGSIAISGARIVSRGSTISADSPAFGGNVDIRAAELVYLVGSVINATSRGGTNAQGLAGGNILIDPPAVVLNQSTLTANGFGNANGGNIFIAGNPLLISADSAITASSQFGTAGTIVFASPNAEVTGELAALPSEFLDASSLLAEACLARDEVTGTFTVRSAGALRPPDAPLGPDVGSAGEQCDTR